METSGLEKLTSHHEIPPKLKSSLRFTFSDVQTLDDAASAVAEQQKAKYCRYEKKDPNATHSYVMMEYQFTNGEAVVFEFPSPSGADNASSMSIYSSAQISTEEIDELLNNLAYQLTLAYFQKRDNAAVGISSTTVSTNTFKHEVIRKIKKSQNIRKQYYALITEINDTLSELNVIESILEDPDSAMNMPPALYIALELERQQAKSLLDNLKKYDPKQTNGVANYKPINIVPLEQRFYLD